MIRKEFLTTIIEASENCYLTQSNDVELQDRIVASTIALGKNDSVDNWKEITIEEGDSIKQQQEELHKQEFESQEEK